VASYCKSCRNEYAKSWYQKNKKRARETAKKTREKHSEKNRLRVKKYQKENQEKIQEYRKEHYLKNKETLREKIKIYRRKNSEKISATRKKYVSKNKERVLEISRNWARKNPEKIRGYWNKRQEYIKRATPKWADNSEIEKIYVESSRLTRLTGIRHHVDHIIPLTHPLVCGLHIPDNLQILTASENCKKHNRFNNRGDHGQVDDGKQCEAGGKGESHDAATDGVSEFADGAGTRSTIVTPPTAVSV
jgi:hypothetical protein